MVFAAAGVNYEAGFDPLIRHLNTQKITCQRLESIADIAPAKAEKPLSITEKFNAVIDKLNKSKTNRPQKEKPLRSFINALFAGHLSEDDLDKVIELLIKRKVIKIADKKVHYELPT